MSTCVDVLVVNEVVDEGDDVTPEEADMTALVARAEDDDPLAALRALATLRREVEQRETVAVRRARHAGVSWAAIALMLGVSKQAAHRKYGGRGRGA